MTKKLFIPGPVEVKGDILKEMSHPLISHRSKEASELQKGISGKLQKLMFTQNEILLSTSSGSGLMEGAVRSCTQKCAAIFSCGAFGERWYQMAVANQVEADLIEVEYGQPIRGKLVKDTLDKGKYDLIAITHNETSTGLMNPLSEIAEAVKRYPEIVFCVDAVSSLGGVKIEVDRLGVDICLSSSQKCLGLPPGLSLCSISQKALEAARGVKHRGVYFDLLGLYEYKVKKDFQYPFTPSLSHMFALDRQLDSILKEGLDNRFERHKEMARLVQKWGKDKFTLFPQEEFASSTVTCIRNNRKLNIERIIQKLADAGFVISNGYGKLKDKTFRIAHMGDVTGKEIGELLHTIDYYILAGGSD
ncbi:MAG TPA: alanine--glyoxylate aminotransferase family protein [Atribacterota bacterium]|nr:alanine--glyoxylate aminotransferase family protein [Atribacterota bacterium]